MTMRILICSLNFPPELIGIGKYVGEMSEWFCWNGHEVRVITTPPYYPGWKVHENYSRYMWMSEKWRGVKVWRCPIYVPPKPSGFKRILHLVSFGLSGFPVMICQIFWRPNIVLSIEPTLFMAPVAIFVSKISGAKSIIHIQDLEVDAAFEMGLLRGEILKNLVLYFEKFLLMRFDLISTISNKMLLKVANKLDGKRRLTLFPNWTRMGSTVEDLTFDSIDVESRHFRTDLNLPKEAVIALYSGNMGEKQGLEILAQSARWFQDNPVLGISVHFVFCGNGSSLEKLVSLSNGLLNVHFLDLQPIEKLPALLAMADIHLLPQRSDVADLVMPSKLIGMLASGRPVLACASLGTELAEVVNGRGLVVPPGNIDRFCEALKILINDRNLREELGAVGRQYAEQNFDQDLILARFESEMKQLTQC